MAGLTSEGEPVVITTLFTSPLEPTEQKAEEPGLNGWVEGETYFTDGEPQRESTKVLLADLPQIAPESFIPEQTTAIASTSFSLAWAEGAGTAFDVYRDGELIGTSSDGTYADSGLEPETEYTYQVKSAEGDAIIERTYSVETLPTDASATMRSSKDPLAVLAVPPSAGWFLYDTFITDQYVPLTTLMQASGCVGQIGQKYGGNNRVYTTPSLWDHPWQYRGVKTGAMAKVDFVNGSPYAMQDKLVAPTYLYNQNGSLAETRTASANGIKFLDQAASSTLYQFRVSHTVGNPFCTSGAIRYEANVNIWKSGVMQLNGYRHPVPHHESYGLFTFSNGSNAWIQMYRGANQSFDCLSGLCATQLLSKTYTPS